ncbi:helix-turn-helix domain-containing protein [Morganella morganii]|uniref:helix-turn-helix domain-containing protein n=1 Tax=Morganella morganii TaxID=582 RepID=UPI003D32EAE8|nr:helix-turn-helix domain-containing protein [Morganella morganii]
MKNITVTKCIGMNIRILRQLHGMSTRTLAKELNISQQQISRYERGVNKIDASLIYRLHVFFNVSIDVFFKDINDEIKYNYEYYCIFDNGTL